MTKKVTPKNPRDTKKSDDQRAPKVEGEGSYEATHRYYEGLKKSVDRGDAEELGKKARRAVEGPEGEALKRAEEDAKKRGKEAGAKPAPKSRP